MGPEDKHIVLPGEEKICPIMSARAWVQPQNGIMAASGQMVPVQVTCAGAKCAMAMVHADSKTFVGCGLAIGYEAEVIAAEIHGAHSHLADAMVPANASEGLAGLLRTVIVMDQGYKEAVGATLGRLTESVEKLVELVAWEKAK